MLSNQVQINRYKVNADSTELQLDTIAVEEPLQLSLKQDDHTQVFSLTMRTPGNDKELVYGLLFSEGVISHADDIKQLTWSEVEGVIVANLVTVEIDSGITLDLADNHRQYASYSGCGLCGKTSLKALELKAHRAQNPVAQLLDNQLIARLKELLAEQPLFSQTGGVHAAGLIYYTKGELQLTGSPFFEDVGRHNALDKLIGHELMVNDLQQAGILLLSGRIGFELVQKAVMAGFSMIIALGAPSHLAVQAANQFDIVLVGFAKQNRFNLYTSHAEKLNQKD